MVRVIFYLFIGINWVITLLPLNILYLFSDLLYLLLYYFPSYRRSIVATNLKNSFPEKTADELTEIEKKFYKHLADMFIETLKMTHLNSREMKKRFIVTNPDILQRYKNEGRNIAAICGHYNNWEWMSAIPLYTDMKCVTIYKPLRNKLFDRFLNDLRRKKGFFLTSMSNIVREIIADKNNGINAMYSFISDQTPAKNDIQYWTRFMNQDTPVHTGAGKIAVKYDMAVIFFNNMKIRRGYYTTTIEVLFENATGLSENEITEAHVRKLEQNIREHPEYWIWSHHRWKHKRENQNV